MWRCCSPRLRFLHMTCLPFSANLITGTSIQAQMIGSNAVSPLIFSDEQSAGILWRPCEPRSTSSTPRFILRREIFLLATAGKIPMKFTAPRV